MEIREVSGLYIMTYRHNVFLLHDIVDVVRQKSDGEIMGG